MKYLIINGSPHKGNTWKLTLAAKEEILKRDTDAAFEEIHLFSLKLPFCVGCSNCFRTGNEVCPHYSIVGKLIEAIDNADGVIVCSTCYNMDMTSILKNMFDHLCFMLHRPHFFTKKALVLVSTGGMGGGTAAKRIASNLRGIGFNQCYTMSVGTASWNDYRPSVKMLGKVQKLSRKFCRDVCSEKLHSVRVILLIPYNIFRGMGKYYTKGTEFPTADGDFWTSEERKRNLYDKRVRVPFYKRPVGHFFHFLGNKLGKKMMVTYRKAQSSNANSCDQ